MASRIKFGNVVGEKWDCRFNFSARVVDKALQIHRGIDLTCDFPLERWFRDQRSRLIMEGFSEIMRMIVAWYVLKR